MTSSLICGIGRKLLLTAAIITPLFSSTSALACACGCGIFDVGTDVMLPTHEGARISMTYSAINQDNNMHGSSDADAANNDDKEVKTKTLTFGAQYMFNRSWGIEASIPLQRRSFVTTDDATGDIVGFRHSDIGDIKVKGIYSGFSDDMSTGITFGLKLPTGDDNYAHFDRDTQIGTGSTDVLLGAYHMGRIAAEWSWFANAQLDLPALSHGGYRPGSEIDAAIGVYYRGWSAGDVKISPLVQLNNTYKWKDSGINSMAANSGYEMATISPGVELSYGATKLSGNLGFPVYEHVRGNQLMPSELFRITLSHSF